VQVVGVHQWLQLWNTIGLAHPGTFAIMIAIIESLAALTLILGAFSNAAFIGTAVLSFCIWSVTEGFHLPFTGDFVYHATDPTMQVFLDQT
jgi:thiosulfate dehydrogenase (quinone) large subunit